MPRDESRNPRYGDASPEDVARALLRPLAPRPRREAVGSDEIAVEQPPTDEACDDIRHLR